MAEVWKTILAFWCGAGGLAIINIAQERWKWRADRKAAKEDRKEEKEDQLSELSKKLDGFIESQNAFNKEMMEWKEQMDQQMAAQSEALKLVLLDRILYLGQSYIDKGEVTFDNRKRLREMHDAYHNGLKGNGDADSIMKAVDLLPLKH